MNNLGYCIILNIILQYFYPGGELLNNIAINSDGFMAFLCSILKNETFFDVCIVIHIE